MKKLTLRTAITRDGKEIKSIEFRDLTVRDIENSAEYDNAATMQIARISSVTGLAMDEVRELHPKDYLDACEIINELFT